MKGPKYRNETDRQCDELAALIVQIENVRTAVLRNGLSLIEVHGLAATKLDDAITSVKAARNVLLDSH